MDVKEVADTFGHFLKTNDIGIFIVEFFEYHSYSVDKCVLLVGIPCTSDIKSRKFQEKTPHNFDDYAILSKNGKKVKAFFNFFEKCPGMKSYFPLSP